MKKFLSLFLVVFLGIASPSFATTFSLQDSSSLADGQSASATNVVNNLNYIYTNLNNGLGTSNLADGCVTGAKIAAGTITADKLAAGAAGVTLYTDNVADDGATDSTSSTSYVDMNSMSHTITTGNSDLEVDFNCDFAQSALGTPTFAIVVDGVVKVERQKGRQVDFNVHDHISLHWGQTITSGSHTVKIQYKTNGPTITIYGRTMLSKEE